MLDQLLQLVRENAGEAIISNPAIDNKNNDAAIETAAGSIFDNLKGMAGGGNLDSILNLFQGGGDVSAHPAINNISSGVAGDLMKKFGLDQGAAANIVQQLIPTVMNKLVKKTNDPNDSSIDLQGILGALTGGKPKGGGILNTIKGLFGG
ncbi:MAG TPA: DUF937 domain-containing protein [Bacteroidales bacterium]|nr:DUF937 domain-containing protein [Bacteroidales bacterium]